MRKLEFVKRTKLHNETGACLDKNKCNVVYTDMGNKWGSANPVTGIWSGLIGMVNTEN